ncbi:hypothetical protein Tco_0590823 [Tanacetum coccineum]
MFATEAEYIAASEAAIKVVWIRTFISGIGIVPTVNGEVIWMAFRENTRDLDLIWEETRQDCNFTRRYLSFGLQHLETAPTFLAKPSEHSRDDIKILSDAVKVTDSEEARRRFAG